MASIEFDIGDDYDRKCGEMFLTLKGNIIFHCLLCENKFTIFEEYADHVLLHYIKNSNLKQEITDEIQPAQLNDDNRVLVPKSQKSKPPPISELMTKLFECDNYLSKEVTIKEEIPDENVQEPILPETQSNNNPTNFEAFDIKVEFSEKEFSDNDESTNDNFNQADLGKFNYIYECSQCDEDFSSSKNLQDHLSQQHNSLTMAEQDTTHLETKGASSETVVFKTSQEVFVCDGCGRGFQASSELEEHIEYYNNRNNRKCTYCERVFDTSKTLHRHMGVHYQERHYECDICKARFKKQQGLFDHCKNVHESKERTFACKMCNETFRLKAGLKWHVRTNHTKNTDNNYNSMENMEIDCLGCHVNALTSAALI